MKRLLPFLFLLFFFSSTRSTHAQTNWITAILNFFTGKTSTYISKDPDIDINSDNSQVTTYSSSNNYDYTHRAISQTNRQINRGQHINDIILNKYAPTDTDPNTIYERDDKILAVLCNGQCQNSGNTTDGCRAVRISEVAFYYLTQGQSTSYKIKDGTLTQIPFSDDVVTKLNNTYQVKIDLPATDSAHLVLAPESCYKRLYDLIPITPKSNDTEQSPKNTTRSEQLTHVETTILPNTAAQEPIKMSFFDLIKNWFDGGQTEQVETNFYRENQYLHRLTPQGQKESVGLSNDSTNDDLRDNFGKLMKPSSWQK